MNISNNKLIGVLGGMGPEATVLFMHSVIQKTKAKDDSEHIPLLVYNNTQVPSRIKALFENSNDDPAPVLESMAKKLEKNQVKALAMPCNSAHYYANKIQKSVNIPLLNMIDLTVKQECFSNSDIKKIGILASPITAKLKLFNYAFSKKNIDIIYPKNQALMLQAIKAIKTNSQDENAISIFIDACCELTNKSVDILLVGCSEFSIVSKYIPKTMIYIDTIDVLAKAVVDFSMDKNQA